MANTELTQAQIDRATQALEVTLGDLSPLYEADELYLLTPYTAGFDGKATVLDIINTVANAIKEPAADEMATDILSQLHSITRGMDKDECESPDGWWETSNGAEFGARKLSELEELITGLTDV